MIQLTRTGIRCSSDLEALREEFAANHVVRLPQLLSADIMSKVWERMECGPWIENVHSDISRELLLDDAQAANLLNFVASSPAFFSAIQKITSCTNATNFMGRIYRMLPGDHHMSWHTDISDGEGRLVGLSVNLSPRPYSGGVFQLRPRCSTELLCELPNTGSADAFLFRISPELSHRVTPVEGAEPKTAFAGWFKSSGTDFLTVIRQRASQADNGL
jgi:hypothetical protein